MSENLGLGKLIEGHAERDAVHIAVLPATAAARLAPGQHVSVHPDAVAFATGQLIGIVDPFLTAPVFAGERFWVFLYPGSITSLRHDWTHAALDRPAVATAAPAPPTRSEAEAWLRRFAIEWGMNFQRMLKDASLGSGITAIDREIHGWEEAGDGVKDAFWQNLEIYLGLKFDASHRNDTYFSCSC